ncbi:MAG: hypothetical protein ACOY94_29045 [Bacillota bacterium]
MGQTVVGVFRHSGDADLAAAHLRDEYALDADELDIIGEAEFNNLARPTMDRANGWIFAAFTGGILQLGDEDPVSKRWGDLVWKGQTLVVARSDDPDRAVDIAGEMRRAGAERVDLLPH